MDKIKVVLITEGDRIALRQWNALAACRDILEVVLVARCRNTRIKRQYGRHFLYYGLNAVSVRCGTGLGEIIRLDPETGATGGVALAGAHFSYPQSFRHGGLHQLLPETASWSAPLL